MTILFICFIFIWDPQDKYSLFVSFIFYFWDVWWLFYLCSYSNKLHADSETYEFSMEKLSTTKCQDPSSECQLLPLGTHSERLMLNNTVFAFANRVQVTCYSHERLFCHTIFKALIFFSLLIKDTLLRTGSHDLSTWRLCIFSFFLFHVFSRNDFSIPACYMSYGRCYHVFLVYFYF